MARHTLRKPLYGTPRCPLPCLSLPVASAREAMHPHGQRLSAAAGSLMVNYEKSDSGLNATDATF